MIKIIPTTIPDILLITPQIFEDTRGYFFESYHEIELSEAINRPIHFMQDNHSMSEKNVLRGLHYQINYPQAKLIRVIKGEIFDVAVDIRPSSPSFGTWVGHILTAKDKTQMFIPEGFAHGFLTLTPESEVLYKVSAPYSKTDERTIIWNDPTLKIDWPIIAPPILSEKDAQGGEFKKMIENIMK